MSKLTKSTLEGILTRALALREPEFYLSKYGALINGSVVSPTFKGKRDLKRQRMIWDALDRALGDASVKKVGMILAYTPDEWYIDADIEGRPRPRRRAARAE